MVVDAFKETMIQVIVYAQVILVVSIFYQVYQLFQIFKGDPTPILKAKEKQARRKEWWQRIKLRRMKKAEGKEIKEDELEIKDEKVLIGLLETILADLKQEHGITEIDRLLKHMGQIRGRLSHLEKLERAEIKNFKTFLQEAPHHEGLWNEIKKEGKLTMLLEQLFLNAEENLTKNPNIAEKDIVAMINILKSLIVEEKKQEKMAA
jgi:hypothetical protein